LIALALVQPSGQRIEPSDSARRRNPLGFQGSRQGFQPIRGKFARLDSRQDAPQDFQVPKGFVHSAGPDGGGKAQSLDDPLPQTPRNDDLNRQQQQKRPGDPGPESTGQRGHRRQRQSCTEPPESFATQYNRFCGPLNQRFRVQMRAHLDAHSPQVLPEIQERGQFRHSALSLCNRPGFRSRLQPFRQGSLSHPGPSGAEQFKKRTSPEEIQVAGIQMVLIGELFARSPATRPAILHPGQARLVECHRAPGPLFRLQTAAMIENQSGKERQRNRSPGGREKSAERSHAGQNHKESEQQESEVRDLVVPPRQTIRLGSAPLQPLTIFSQNPLSGIEVFIHRATSCRRSFTGGQYRGIQAGNPTERMQRRMRGRGYRREHPFWVDGNQTPRTMNGYRQPSKRAEYA